MLRKSLLTALLCIGLIAVVSAETQAWCRLSADRTRMVCGSVCADAFLKGVGTPDINTTNVCVSLRPIEVELFCQNHGGNSSTANGTPFFPDVVLTAGDMVRVEDIIDLKKGNALKEICFEDSEIYAQLQSSSDFPNACDYCQNCNWGWNENKVQIIQAYVYYSTYAPDGKDLNTLPDLTSELCQFCEFDTDAQVCSYTCTNVSSTDPRYPNCVALATSCADLVQ